MHACIKTDIDMLRHDDDDNGENMLMEKFSLC